MKSIQIIFLLICFLPINLYAQNYKWQIGYKSGLSLSAFHTNYSLGGKVDYQVYDPHHFSQVGFSNEFSIERIKNNHFTIGFFVQYYTAKYKFSQTYGWTDYESFKTDSRQSTQTNLVLGLGQFKFSSKNTRPFQVYGFISPCLHVVFSTHNIFELNHHPNSTYEYSDYKIFNNSALSNQIYLSFKSGIGASYCVYRQLYLDFNLVYYIKLLKFEELFVKDPHVYSKVYDVGLTNWDPTIRSRYSDNILSFDGLNSFTSHIFIQLGVNYRFGKDWGSDDP